MPAQVSNGSTNPETATVCSVQPSSRASASSHSWKACVATVFACSTMTCQRASRATRCAREPAREHVRGLNRVLGRPGP